MKKEISVPILEKILENIDEGLHYVDRECITQIYNQNMEKIEGMDRKLILGKNFRTIFKDIPEEDSTLLKALKGISTKNKNIAVISTKFTAESHGYKNKAKMLDSELNVKEIACIEFAQMIESGWDTFDNRKELLNKYLSEIPKNADTLVLGCTHYPLIRKDIEKNIRIKVVDPAVEIVERATQTLTTLNLLNDKKEKGKVIFFVTGETYHFKPTAEKFLGKEIEIYRIPK